MHLLPRGDGGLAGQGGGVAVELHGDLSRRVSRDIGRVVGGVRGLVDRGGAHGRLRAGDVGALGAVDLDAQRVLVSARLPGGRSALGGAGVLLGAEAVVEDDVGAGGGDVELQDGLVIDVGAGHLGQSRRVLDDAEVTGGVQGVVGSQDRGAGDVGIGVGGGIGVDEGAGGQGDALGDGVAVTGQALDGADLDVLAGDGCVGDCRLRTGDHLSQGLGAHRGGVTQGGGGLPRRIRRCSGHRRAGRTQGERSQESDC